MTEISPSEWKEMVERFARPIMVLKFLNYIYYGLSSWHKQENELTSNRETERLHDYVPGKPSRMVSESQSRAVSTTQISPCEYRHLNTCTKSLSHGVSILVASRFEFHSVSLAYYTQVAKYFIVGRIIFEV